jgi:hypothetical protein
VYFKEGIAIGRQVGYEGLRITTSSSIPVSSTAAASTDFSTASLARSMRDQGVLGTEPIVGAIDEDEDNDEEDEDAIIAGLASRVRRLGNGGAVVGGAADATTLSNKNSSGVIPLTSEEREKAMQEARKRMLEELEASEDF